MNKVMVYIIYDRAIDDEIIETLASLEINYYTRWKDVTGIGTKDPHLGDHVWPGLNNVTIVIVDEAKKERLLQKIRLLQSELQTVGLRALVVPVLDFV